jgi:hypothetical protein
MQAPSGKKMIDELKKSARKGNTVTIRDGANSAACARLNDKQQGSYSDLSFGEKNDKAIELAQKKTGSRRESVRSVVSRGIVKSDELGSCGGQALCFQEQVVEVAVAASTAEQGFDVAVDRLDHSQRNLGPAVVQDSI